MIALHWCLKHIIIVKTMKIDLLLSNPTRDKTNKPVLYNHTICMWSCITEIIVISELWILLSVEQMLSNVRMFYVSIYKFIFCLDCPRRKELYISKMSSWNIVGWLAFVAASTYNFVSLKQTQHVLLSKWLV